MDFVSKYQGVVGRVFRNDNSSSNEDSYVERLLDRISNGVLAEDRRSAMVELQSVVAESNAAQLAFGAMGFPVLLSVLKEERDDVEMDLLSRNATLAENAAKTGASGSSQLEHRGTAGSERVLVETLRRDLHETSQRLEALKAEKARIEVEASTHQNLAAKLESDLKSLSDAYNSLEQANFQLDREVKALKSGGALPIPDIEEIKAEAREEAQKESEAELSDLLVCLGQEQSKVEKLSARLMELGEDVDKLLEGIGDDMGVPEDDEEEAE
ncbi:UNVERIFIED_CONTAM: Golgin candidate 6 [Sesamum indicum]